MQLTEYRLLIEWHHHHKTTLWSKNLLSPTTFSVVFLIVLILILIVLNVHTVLYVCVQGYLLVPLSLSVLLSQCIVYVYRLTFISTQAYFDNKIQFSYLIGDNALIISVVVQQGRTYGCGKVFSKIQRVVSFPINLQPYGSFSTATMWCYFLII